MVVVPEIFRAADPLEMRRGPNAPVARHGIPSGAMEVVGPLVDVVGPRLDRGGPFAIAPDARDAARAEGAQDLLLRCGAWVARDEEADGVIHEWQLGRAEVAGGDAAREAQGVESLSHVSNERGVLAEDVDDPGGAIRDRRGQIGILLVAGDVDDEAAFEVGPINDRGGLFPCRVGRGRRGGGGVQRQSKKECAKKALGRGGRSHVTP